MKKVLSLLLSITMLLSITAGLDLTAYAQTLTGSCGENVTYTLDTDSGLLTISGTGPMTNCSSLSSIPWYNNRSSVKTVEIEYGVTSIGDCAFESCTSLTSVIIGNGVTSIGDCAFGSCRSLTSITIPNGVTSIGKNAFYDCSSLTNVTIPSSVASIGNGVFHSCSRLTDIVVDNDNQNYSSKDGVLFDNNKTTLIQYPVGNSRTKYTIPNSVSTISDLAFYDYNDNHRMNTVVIPDSIKYIGESSFNCSLTTVFYLGNGEQWNNISINYNNTYLKKSKIYYLNSFEIAVGDIQDVEINTGDDKKFFLFQPKESGDYTFYSTGSCATAGYVYDTEMNELNRDEWYGGESDNFLIKHCFEAGKKYYLCAKIDSQSDTGNFKVVIKELPVINGIQYEFFENETAKVVEYKGDEATVAIPNEVNGYTVTSIGDRAFSECSSLTSVTIPNSVTSIGDRAFYSCDSLTSVTIPSNVTKIGDSAFSYCNSLSSISVDKDNNYYLSEDGILFDKNKTNLIQYPIGNSRTSYTIPNSVSCIGLSAFALCSSLAGVTIPSSVTSIGDFAFSYCIGLTELKIPNSVTSIGVGAFQCCVKLKSVVIPNKITRIELWLFSGCKSLTKVFIPKSVKQIMPMVFEPYESKIDIYYSGAEQDWNNIDILDKNSLMSNINIHYNCKEPCEVHTPGEAISENIKEATCTTIGSYDCVVYCSVCNYELSRTEIIVENIGHDYKNAVTLPSCTQGGYTTHSCLICGDSYVDSYTNPPGHSFNGGKNCVVCGEIDPNYVEPTPTPIPTPQPQPTPTQPTNTAPVQTTTQDTQTTSQDTQTTTQPAKAVKKPKSTSIKKLTKGKKSFKITFKKVTGISGYEVQYATDKKFKKNIKSVTVKKSKTSTTVKKLKANKKYYVRVRTYKTVNGKKIYSSWSKVKSVKTK